MTSFQPRLYYFWTRREVVTLALPAVLDSRWHSALCTNKGHGFKTALRQSKRLCYSLNLRTWFSSPVPTCLIPAGTSSCSAVVYVSQRADRCVRQVTHGQAGLALWKSFLLRIHLKQLSREGSGPAFPRVDPGGGVCARSATC